MQDRDGEFHVETDEARGGSTPNVVRWVLGIGLLLAVVAMSLAWIIPSMTQDRSVMDSQNADLNMQKAQERAGGTDGTDSIVTPEQANPAQGELSSADTDATASVTPGQPEGAGQPTVANDGQ